MDVEKRLEDLEKRLSRVEAELRLEAPRSFPREATVAPAPAPAARPAAPTARAATPPPIPAPAITPDVVAARLARLERDTLAPPSTPTVTSPLPTLAVPPPIASPVPAAPSVPSSTRIVSAPLPRAAIARPSTPARPPAKTSIDYERFVGVAVLGRVGIAAVLLAAGYFGQLGWKEIGPWGKVTVVYGLAAVFIAVGALLRAKVSRLYLALLWGGGTAAMYLAGVLAKLRFGLVGHTEALGMLVVACAVGQFLASKAKLQVLAITALAGAFAAPVLVGGPEDARTVLCVYLLALHGWGAFTEAKFGWVGARLVGLLGTGVVGLLWLTTHGHADVSTMLHVQAYLFGLTAPEWGSAVLGRDVPKLRTVVLFRLLLTFEGLAFVVASLADLGNSTVLSNVLPGTAVAWALLAVVSRARVAAPTPMSTALARLAAFLLVPAAWTVFSNRGLSHSDVATGSLVALAALSIGLLAARRRFGVGDGGPLGASALSILVLADLAHPDARLFLALVPAAALVGWARDVRLRAGGYAAGIAAIAVGFLDVPSLWWTAAAFASFAAWAVLALESRRLRPSDGFDVFVDLSLVVSVVVWAGFAFASRGAYLHVATPFYNPGTAAALALAAALVVRAPWRGEKAFPRGTAPLVGSALVALVGLVAWRELHAALAAHASASAQAGVETFFFVVASLGAIALGRKTGVRAFAALAGFLLLLGVGRAVDGFTVHGSAWWVAAELGSLAVGSFLLGATAPSGEKPDRIASAILLVGTAIVWIAAMEVGALPGAALVANPRFAAGVFLAAALAAARFQGARGLVREFVVILGVASALVGFEAGRREVVAAVTALDSEAWKAVLVSVYAALFAGGVLAVGFWRRAADLRWLALTGFGLIVLQVGLHDLASVSTPLRILVTGCLGLVLLTAAYAYARGRRTEAALAAAPVPDPAPPPPPAFRAELP